MRQIFILAAVLLVGGGYLARYADKAVVETPASQAAVVQESEQPRQTSVGQHKMELSSGRDGHFRVDARVDGGRVEFIVDTGASHKVDGNHHIRVFDVVGGTKLGKGRLFANISPGIPDGLRLDTDGNIWTSAGDGVHCYSPEGELLGKIRVPEVVSNLCFGGPKRNRLFITGTTSLYACYVAQAGAVRPIRATTAPASGRIKFLDSDMRDSSTQQVKRASLML